MLIHGRFIKQRSVSWCRHGLGLKRGGIGRPRSQCGQKHPLCGNCRPDEYCDTTSSPFQMGEKKKNPISKSITEMLINSVTSIQRTSNQHSDVTNPPTPALFPLLFFTLFPFLSALLFNGPTLVTLVLSRGFLSPSFCPSTQNSQSHWHGKLNTHNLVPPGTHLCFFPYISRQTGRRVREGVGPHRKTD